MITEYALAKKYRQGRIFFIIMQTINLFVGYNYTTEFIDIYAFSPCQKHETVKC